MRSLRRMVIAAAVAAVPVLALVLERRRARRLTQPRNAPAQTKPKTTPKPQHAALDLHDQADLTPQLSRGWFAALHFGLLGLLLVTVAGGLLLQDIQRYPPRTTWHVDGGDPERGRTAIRVHGCGGCHAIPGIGGATGRVGPMLHGFAEQMYIGGQLPNTPGNLVSWLQDPQRHAPGTAMPALGLDLRDARDIAAYLYSYSGR